MLDGWVEGEAARVGAGGRGPVQGVMNLPRPSLRRLDFEILLRCVNTVHLRWFTSTGCHLWAHRNETESWILDSYCKNAAKAAAAAADVVMNHMHSFRRSEARW